jgi:hypothetical protein
MRLVALVLATLVVSASALPALADCPYKDQVAKYESQNGSGGQNELRIDESHG